MEPVRGDPKAIVRSGYDECAQSYAESRPADPPEIVDRLVRLLPSDAEVLEIGCGAGEPVTVSLAANARVTGVDISRSQLDLARTVLPPTAVLICGDIMEQAFEPASFDAIVAFYMLFHLPREDHLTLLERVRRWLKPGGYLLLTTSRTGHEGYTESDFFGVTMYWSHFEAQWYPPSLESLGYDVLEWGSLPRESGDNHDHPVILAQVPSATTICGSPAS